MPQRKRNAEPPAPQRPPIWVAGSQRPKFHLRAWGCVGQAMTRRWLAPRLTGAARRIAIWGGQVASGRFRLNTAWMGKAACIVPAYTFVARAITGFGARLAEAAMILLPQAAAPEPLAYPNLIRPDFQARSPRPMVDHTAALPVTPTPPAALPIPTQQPGPLPSALVEPTLSAIRAMIYADPTPANPKRADLKRADPTRADLTRADPQTQPRRGARPAPVITADPAPDATPVSPNLTPARWLGPLLARVAAHGIGWSLLTLTLPVGLVRATLYHLNGGDLADWD